MKKWRVGCRDCVNDSERLLLAPLDVGGDSQWRLTDCNARQLWPCSHFFSGSISALTRYSIPVHEEYTLHAQLCVGRILTIWEERHENRPGILAITRRVPMRVPARQFAQWEGW